MLLVLRTFLFKNKKNPGQSVEFVFVKGVDQGVAHLQHYKLSCSPRLATVCQKEYKNQRIKDTSIFSTKDIVMKRTEATLQDLGYI